MYTLPKKLHTKIFLLLTLFSPICIIPAKASVYNMPAPGNDLVGENLIVRADNDDSLLTIGNRYDIGMHEMMEANTKLHMTEDAASQRLRPGTKVRVPGQFVLPPFRKGIVVNLPELRLYYFTSDGSQVYTYPVGLGRMEWRTPLTSTTVVRKQKDPVWHVPKSIHQYVLEETGRSLPEYIPPGPENPLGHYAMYLSMGNYLIHGTNQPWSIGKFVSSGCIRMHNEDVAELYQLVHTGTPVRIINYANKAGWDNGQFYVEAQVPMMVDSPNGSLNPASVQDAVEPAAAKRKAQVDWSEVQAVVEEQHGMPTPIRTTVRGYASSSDSQFR